MRIDNQLLPGSELAAPIRRYFSLARQLHRDVILSRQAKDLASSLKCGMLRVLSMTPIENFLTAPQLSGRKGRRSVACSS
jgi:hypothetical protein